MDETVDYPAYILHFFQAGHRRIRAMISKLPARNLLHQISSDPKHPLWVIGHLCCVRDYILRWAGRPTVCDESWEALFGNGSEPSRTGGYPPFPELLRTFDETARRVTEVLEELNDAKYSAPIPDSTLKFPTKRHGIFFEALSHEAIHFGQLRVLVKSISETSAPTSERP